ncbi:MAG: ATP-binding protein [Bacteroidia bacterium]
MATLGGAILVIAILLAVYDYSRSDADLLKTVEENIQKDFNDLTYKIENQKPLGISSDLLVCKLLYDSVENDGKLLNWLGHHYLPPFQNIGKIGNVPIQQVLNYGNKIYYQIRKRVEGGTAVYLIPISIRYEIVNDFLKPYIFLGRYYPKISQADIQQVSLTTIRPKSDAIVLRTPLGRPLFYIENIPLLQIRKPIRQVVLLLIVLGWALCTAAAYHYLHGKFKQRRYKFWAIIGGFGFIRLLMILLDLPNSYLPIPLFSADILAFHTLAPSLGELGINVFTLLILVWVLYLNFYPTLPIWVEKLKQHRRWIFPIFLLGNFLVVALLYLYFNIFNEIIINSQIGIDFSNVFRTDFYSYIILLVVGALLLTVFLPVKSILFLQYHFVQQIRLPIRHRLFAYFLYLMGLFVFIAILFKNPTHEYWMIPIVAVLLTVIVARTENITLIHFDLLSYVPFLIAMSIIISFNVMRGTEMKRRANSERIASSVFRDRSQNIIVNYQTAIYKIEKDLPRIFRTYAQRTDNDEFSAWLTATYFSNNFNAKISLSMYDSVGILLNHQSSGEDPLPKETTKNSGEFIASTETAIDSGLYLVPFYEKTFDDIYVGNFQLKEDTINLQFLLAIRPGQLNISQIYPALLQDKESYRKVKESNLYDFATYRDGKLYSTSGKTAFPIRLAVGDTVYKTSFHQESEKYDDYYDAVDERKVVVVRYAKSDSSSFVNSFSIIFFFFTILVIVLLFGYFVVRTVLRKTHFTLELSLRNKIQVSLFSVSLIPLLFITASLLPTVRERFYQQMDEGLKLETNRIVDAISRQYLEVRAVLYRVMSERDRRNLQDRIKELGVLMRTDINLYDEYGRLLVTTQPLILESGLSSGMMNNEVFDEFRRTLKSEIVIKEKIGKLTYQSGFKVINDDKPVGYINVPYLAKQDEIDEKVFDILAYITNIYLAVLLLVSLLTIILSRQMTRPLQIIQQRLSDIKLGDVNELINYNTNDEIGEIIQTYNNMVEKLAESEKKLAQSQRDFAWRQMARQVAHEIKNPLTPMKLSLQHLSRSWSEKSDKLEKMFPKVVNTILVQIDSLARIADTFSEFAKMPETEKSMMHLNEVLREVTDLYEQSQSSSISIQVSIPEKPFYIFADRDQISRVFNNIIKNGLQAIEMADKAKGNLFISMRIEPHLAYIQIQDDGIGMSEEVQKKAFEPNFSTKSSGMGLGLAIVRRIIETSGGNIYFESQEGEGTTFFIELPAVEAVK